MSDIWVSSTESAPLTDESRLVACEIIADIKAELLLDIPTSEILGLTAPERALKDMRQTDREYQEKYGGDGSIVFGQTRKPYIYLYNALLRGYGPTKDQLAARDEAYGHDFLWDEIMQLEHNHPDIAEVLRERNDIPKYYMYVIAEDVLKDALGVLFMRGEEYREWGWGFPWTSDPIGIAIQEEHMFVSAAEAIS